MALIKINDNPSRRELRQFAAIWFPAFWLLIATFLYLAGVDLRAAGGAAAVGIIAGGIGFVRPAFIHPIYLIWLYAAYPIGWVVSHLLLGAIFYALVTPIGLMMRLFGYDPLQRRMGTAQPTYWTPCEPVTNQAQYFRQF